MSDLTITPAVHQVSEAPRRTCLLSQSREMSISPPSTGASSSTTSAAGCTRAALAITSPITSPGAHRPPMAISAISSPPQSSPGSAAGGLPPLPSLLSLSLSPLDMTSPTSACSPTQSIDSATSATSLSSTSRMTASALDDATREQRQAVLNARAQSAALRESIQVQVPKSTTSHRRALSRENFSLALAHIPARSARGASAGHLSPDTVTHTPVGPHTTRANQHTRGHSLYPVRFPLVGGASSPLQSDRAAAGGGWSMKLTRPSVKTPGSTTSATSSEPSPGQASPSLANRFSMQLNIADFTLDRAESYVVREHTVVVGSYRINQNGLFADNTMSPLGGYDEEEEEEEEEPEQEGHEGEAGEEHDLVEAQLELAEAVDRTPATPGQDLEARHARRSSALIGFRRAGQPLFDTAGATAQLVSQFDDASPPSQTRTLGAPEADGSKTPASPTLDQAVLDMFVRKPEPPSSATKSGGSRRGSMVGGLGGSNRRKSLAPGQSALPPATHAMSLSKEDLVELEIIGRGQNGNVRKAVHLPTLTRVALKTMDVYDKSTRHQLLHELHAFSGLNSPHLIRLLGAYHDSGVIYLASEYMDAGSLSHCMKRCGGLITDEVLLKYLSHEILLGLKYLHDNHRVHRDIKPDNILMARDASVKIGDFGLMAKVDPAHPVCTEFMGTLAYLSPERLASAEYSYPGDIWSLGVSLIYACTGHLPIVGGSFWEFLAAIEAQTPSLANTIADIRSGANQIRVSDGTKASDNVAAGDSAQASPASGSSSPTSGCAVLSPVLTDENAYRPPAISGRELNFSAEFHDFIAAMLKMDPAERATAQQLLDHPFLRDIGTVAPLARAHSFWTHHTILAKNQHDLDLILEILAKRQLLKQANAESMRLSQQQHVGFSTMPVNSPGCAVNAAAYPFSAMMLQSEAAQAKFEVKAIQVASPSIPASSPTQQLSANDFSLSLKLTSPPSSQSTTGEGEANPSSSVRGGGGSSAGSSLSSMSSPFSGLSSTSSSGSLSSVRSSADSLFSPGETGGAIFESAFLPRSQLLQVGQSMMSQQSDLFSPQSAGPVCSPVEGFGCSASPMHPQDAGSMFVSPEPPTPMLPSSSPMAHVASSIFSPSNMSFVLPAAPSMMSLPAAPDLILPASMASFGDGGAHGATASYNDHDDMHDPQAPSHQSHGGGAPHASGSPRGGDSSDGPDTVEIMAVVSKLDAVRLRVLSHQFSLPVEAIQARFNDVQVALFDEMEEEQNEAAAQDEAAGDQQMDDDQRKEITFDHEVTADMLASPTRGAEEESFLTKLSFKMRNRPVDPEGDADAAESPAATVAEE